MSSICKHEGCNNISRLNRKECYKCQHNKTHYKITTPERDLLLLKQDNKCSICNNDIEFRGSGQSTEKESFRIAAAVDHCHITGTIRGILCFRCNTVLGHLDEDIELLLKMKEYLNV
jgi:hypothetical protein